MAGAALTARDPVGYPRLLDEAADRAARAVGGYEDRCFRIADHVMRLRCAGRRLASYLAGSMSHLEIAPAAPADLTVNAWADGPSPCADHAGFRRWSGGDGLSFVQWGEGSLSGLDATRDAGHLWVQSLDRPVDVGVAPVSPILSAWLPSRGLLHAHAGAVGHRDGCVLLAAPSGQGKSTTALACVENGLGYLGDDACLLRADPRPTAYSLYRLAQSLPGEGAPRKAIRHMEDRVMVSEAPLRAIAIVEPSGLRGSRTAVASAAEAVGAIAPSSMLRLPAPREAVLRGLARIAATVPCHRLEAGTDAAGLAAAVRALL